MTALAQTGTGGWPFWVLPAAFLLVFVVVLLGRRLPIRRIRHEPYFRPTPRQSKGCSYAFGGLLVVIGALVLFALLLRPVYRAYRADKWPTTEGVVLASKLATSKSKKTTVYRVDVRYRYAVAGRTYEHDRYDSGTGSSNVGVDAMRAAVKACPVGARVTVHYDPTDPTDAMLSTALRTDTLVFGGVPLLLVLFGGFLIVTGSRVEKVPPVPSPGIPGEG